MKNIFILSVISFLALAGNVFAADPTNLSPCYGAQVSSVENITLSWSDVGAYYYMIMISSPGVTPHPYTSFSNSLVIQAEPREYTWYVIAYDENNSAIGQSNNCTFTAVTPTVTCDGKTTHFSNGCEMLLSYDENGNGKIDPNEWTNVANDGNSGQLTNEEVTFILSVFNSGSIQSQCPNCGVPVSGTPGGGTTPGTTPSGGTGLIDLRDLNPLNATSVQGLIGGISSFVWKLAIAIAPIMFLIAGFLFITSGGDPNRVRTAKHFFLYTIIGLAVVLLASGLYQVIKSILGGGA